MAIDLGLVGRGKPGAVSEVDDMDDLVGLVEVVFFLRQGHLDHIVMD